MNISLKKLSSLSLFAFFFIPYIGLISPAYGLMILMIFLSIGKEFKLSYYDFFYLLALLVFVALKFNQVGVYIGEAILRYYLGIVIVYYFVKINSADLDIQKLLFAFCVCVMIEAVVINIFFDPFHYLPNYPKNVYLENLTSHYTKFMGFYQRPYSVGMNASSSATILCAMLIYRHVLITSKEIIADRKIEIMGGIVVLLFASGVGLCLYFFYLLFKFQLLTVKRMLWLFVLCFLLVNYYDVLFELFTSDSIFQKVSAGYMNFLVEYKTMQISDVIDLLREDGSSMLVGRAFQEKAEIILQSDFAWNDLFLCLGVGGVALFILFFINKVNKYTIFPILLFVLGAFHYGGVFTLAGQIIFAQILYHHYGNVNKKALAQELQVIN